MLKMAQNKSDFNIRREQAALVKTIGARMRQARELCNLSQNAAAKRLGYSNSSKLSKVEGATDTNSVPLWLIKRAACAYEVSIDFLFGETDDWETGARMTQEREISAWLQNAFNNVRQRDIETLRLLHNKVELMRDSVTTMHGCTEDVATALARFVELNPEFEESMRGSARLLATVERANTAAKAAKSKMTRFRMECVLAAQDTHQLSLAL